ncbi:lysophospholipid acyltransferase family protein [Pedobacter sp. UYP30]|uniref:lysophospholipid acyltransferase family protein n=1 Tax=Pedobacter sp. UYP30 TaxID=1756400 RepID=UPI003391FC77
MIKKAIAQLGVFFLFLLSLLPLPILFFFARLTYYLLYYIIGYRKKIVRKNLLASFPKKSLPEIVAVEKDFFKYLADLMFEIIKMTTISKKEVLKRFKFMNVDVLRVHLQNSVSVLGCGGHFGNWELGGLSLGLELETKTLMIYKPLSNKVFENWLNKCRSRYGNVLIAMKQTLRALVTYKNEATLLNFVSDQAPARSETKYFIPFLNQPTAVMLGIEKIAKQTNRPVFFFKVRRIKRGYYEGDILPVCLDPSKTVDFEITKKHFALLEACINENPANWLWSHNRWKINPENAQ